MEIKLGRSSSAQPVLTQGDAIRQNAKLCRSYSGKSLNCIKQSEANRQEEAGTGASLVGGGMGSSISDSSALLNAS